MSIQRSTPFAAPLVAATAMAATLSSGAPAVAQGGDAPGPNTTSLGHEVVVSGLQVPWDMAFLDDGTLFFTEICKGLSVRMPDGGINRLLGMGDAEGYATLADDLFCNGQAGMNGVALDPDFEENRRIYVYSVSEMSEPPTNRVMRFTVNEAFSGLSDRTDLIEDIPYKVDPTDHPFGNPGAHNGGRIRFGPDGYLHVTTGDNHNPELPQGPQTLGGKVLRITTDGAPAPGNGTPEGFDPRIFTYGHRNVQGIAFDPDTGTPIITEHGPWHSDEITPLEAGGNGGWDPRANMAGRGDCPDDYCGYMPNQMEGMNRYERASFMPMTDFETYPDAMAPIWENNNYSQGITSITFLEGEQWGAWDGDAVVGYMGIGFGGTPIGQRIDVLDLDDDLTVNDVTEMTLPMDAGRFRSLVLAPDGSLYAAVDAGMVRRLVPGGADAD
ncbi:PQQ-dependent sugar dehydrogenase [Roseibacterium sp. SDUM158017]|uniref:PQQ-dependent sugar dehydrogenase n=1 Tax=Roseicyclus salinarum TaxID=3036773 RepID=UPI0024154042|nr:PQQ-dependent sugar dehydrogenase [Roseibacterium sp. SDUM158017]MDG4649101.1 PQQ-dependent sugar dehydrogenase [Roseibacterium sp. SDUM158017]